MTNAQYKTVTVKLYDKVYKPFKGTIAENMPKLVAEDRRVISPKELMIQRLSGFEGDKDFLTINRVYTSLAIIHNPQEDNVKLCHNVREIYEICPDSYEEGNSRISKFYWGSLKITQELYDKTEGLILADSELTKFWPHGYLEPKTREKVWEHFAEGDTKLVNEYKDFVCKKLDLSFDKVMDLWVSKIKITGYGDFQVKGLKLLCINPVTESERSVADFNQSLDSDVNYLIGVCENSNLEKRLE